MFKKAFASAAVLMMTASVLTGCSSTAEQSAEKEISKADETLVSAVESTEKEVSKADETLVSAAESSEKEVYSVVENADTTSIKNGDLEYVPFSDAEESQIAEQIGTVQFSESEPVKYVYAVDGQNSDQWVIVAGEDKSEPVIYREMSVTEYPEGFVSSYPWN